MSERDSGLEEGASSPEDTAPNLEEASKNDQSASSNQSTPAGDCPSPKKEPSSSGDGDQALNVKVLSRVFPKQSPEKLESVLRKNRGTLSTSMQDLMKEEGGGDSAVKAEAESQEIQERAVLPYKGPTLGNLKRKSDEKGQTDTSKHAKTGHPGRGRSSPVRLRSIRERWGLPLPPGDRNVDSPASPDPQSGPMSFFSPRRNIRKAFELDQKKEGNGKGWKRPPLMDQLVSDPRSSALNTGRGRQPKLTELPGIRLSVSRKKSVSPIIFKSSPSSPDGEPMWRVSSNSAQDARPAPSTPVSPRILHALQNPPSATLNRSQRQRKELLKRERMISILKQEQTRVIESSRKAQSSKETVVKVEEDAPAIPSGSDSREGKVPESREYEDSVGKESESSIGWAKYPQIGPKKQTYTTQSQENPPEEREESIPELRAEDIRKELALVETEGISHKLRNANASDLDNSLRSY